MPKVFRPYQSAAAANKTGTTVNDVIYARTGGTEGDPNKMVTYVKAYQKPVQPNTALQIAQRDLFSDIADAMKALKMAVKKS